MNFGEKFPYALLTFSQKFVEAGYWVHLIPKTCQADCSTHAHLLQKVVKADYWVHYTPPRTTSPKSIPPIQHPVYPIHQPHNPIPTLSTPPTSTPIPHTPTIHQPYTNYTPAIHPPIPLLLRVDSDEMRQNRQVCGS